MKKLILSALLLTFISTPSVFGEEKAKTMGELKAALRKIDKSIKVTRVKMKQIKDVNYLPDMYFVLAELFVEKSRYEFALARKREPDEKVEDLDLTASRKAKREANEVYQRIVELFPKPPHVDRALFYLAHEYRELGAVDDMIRTYATITKKYKNSPFWEESAVILGNHLLEVQKDPKLALKQYQKVLRRPKNPFMPVARYKSGWCYINMQKFKKALLAFEGVLTIDSAINIDELPEIYKKTDVRRDALYAMVWPYSEQKRLTKFRANPVKYFEGLAPNRQALLRTFEKLARRLTIKKRPDDVIPVYYRLLELTSDIEKRVEVVESLHEALRASKRKWPLDGLVKTFSETLIEARHSSVFKKSERKKINSNFEIIIRDIATRTQIRAKKTRRKKDFGRAVAAYQDYLALFPRGKYSRDMRLNLAESYFKAKNFAQAGLQYEKLAKQTKKKRKNLLDSAIQSYAFALKKPKKLTRLELNQSRTGFRSMGASFIKFYPKDRANPMIRFNIARTFYDERNFEKAVTHFNRFIRDYPRHKETVTAGNLILDSYNQREDINGLIRAGKKLIANKNIRNRRFKNEISGIIKQAEYRKIQKSAGDPRGKNYTKKLLGFASKYKGSSLGDQALYEAFITLKAKKDPAAYDPGEQLLAKHGDSKYAKDVVGQMGRMALRSADYRRAATYFEIYAKKYPKDPTSKGLIKSAAEMRELLGDVDEAASNYRSLGGGYTTAVAKQFALSQDWSRLGTTLASTGAGSLKSAYWLGLSLYRQGQVSQAKPYFSKASRMRPRGREEKSMAAHALYLLTAETLGDFRAIQLGSGDESKLVQVKSKKLAALEKQFAKVIRFGDGRWTIAGLYQLGQVNREFANFIEGASIPAGLNAAQKKQYQQLIKQQKRTYSKKAKSYFKSCVKNAEKYEVFTRFAKGCQDPSGDLINESDEEMILAKASDSIPAGSTKIRQTLIDRPKDIKLLMKLAKGYMGAQDYPFARAIYNRVLEIKPRYAPAKANMGLALLSMNDFDGASTHFKSAIKSNPKERVALWGLAAMYKEFNFKRKYKTMLSRAKRAGRPGRIQHPWVSTLL